jgi:hypothetical protein
LQESIEMLNAVPESMRACLIEAAKLAGPAFRRKAADGGGSGGGGLCFNISVDAGRGPSVAAALAAAGAHGGDGGSGALDGGESDPLISGLVGQALGSNPLLGPLPVLPPPPPLPPATMPIAVGARRSILPTAAASVPPAAEGARRAGSVLAEALDVAPRAAEATDQQQLLNLIRWVGLGLPLRKSDAEMSLQYCSFPSVA